MSDTVKKRGRPAMSGTPQTTAERAAAYRARLKAQAEIAGQYAAEVIAKDEMIRRLLLRIADLEQQLHKATNLVSNAKETTPPLQYWGKAYGMCQCLTTKGSRCKSARTSLIRVETPDGIAELAACPNHYKQWLRGEGVKIIASPL